MGIVLQIEEAIEQLESKLSSLKRIVHNNEEEFELLDDYRKKFNKDINDIEAEIAELKEELKIIKARDQD